MATRLGIDIGGTKVNIGLFRTAGEALAESRIGTGPYDETLASIIQECRGLIRTDTEGIGIGCTGPHRDGVILNGDTLPDWRGRNLREDLEAALHLRIVMENDADAALVGEVFAGAGKDLRDETVAMLTFGTGVGGGIWTGRGLLRGAYGEHPEIGHIPIFHDGPPCYCGLNGCLEIVAAGPAVNASGNYDRAKEAIGIALWTLAHTYRPALVILGGGLIEAFPERLVPFEVLTPEQAPMLLEPMQVIRAELGNRAGVVGAAYLLEVK